MHGTTAQTVQVDADAAARYVLSCQKSNGAFGPYDMDYTDLAWTYPAVYALKLLDVPVPNADSCFKNGRQAWIEKASWKNGPWYWSFSQKVDLYRLFGQPGADEEGVAAGVPWKLHYKPRTSYRELRKYPEGEFFDLTSLWHLVGSAQTLRSPIANPEVVKAFILQRQAPGGGFVEGLDSLFTPANENAHLMATCEAVMTLTALGIPVPNKTNVIAWLHACQTSAGGFRWHPSALAHSNQPDVWYTWAAIRALEALGSKPVNPATCLDWLNTLQNPDGGFGDRPGWASRLYSTYYVLHSAQILAGSVRRGITHKQLKEGTPAVIPEGKYRIFQAEHKSPPGDSHMVDTAAAMGFNLLAVKITEKQIDTVEGVSQMVKEARAYAKRKGYPLEIVDFPENYSHRLQWPSGQPADHVSNMLIPPGLSDRELSEYKAAYAMGKKGLPWKDFKEQVIKPMLNLNTLFYPELDYSMTNAYQVYDDGLDGQAGYNAIPGAHFGNSDWMRHFPYKER
ncbi:prenyltransferase/squalene oxidase repeat-containing protein [Persicitalea sp.]|uniref:prenyltransferase/squalene oxidase repeat-containing protein n=1 Tax=Persicitalea sp. TaxID=3100273 RepID=UPI0035940A7E